MSKRKKPDAAPVQGTLFGPADVYGGVTPAPAGRPDLGSPCGVCGHALGRHTAQGEGLCLDCDCGGWSPPRPPPWDHGLTPPTAEELAALHEAHPGALLLFRHPGGCAFHGADALEAHRVAGLPLCGPDGAPYAGWRHGDFPGPMRLLLAAGRTVAVVERGEGLPAGHRLGACPVVTPFTEVTGEDTTGA